MSIAQYLSKFALGVNSQGVLSAAKGGTGNTSGGGGGNSPTVTSISYPGDDTAADPAGGQTITLTGTNFATGVKVLLNSTPVSVVSRVSATTITFTAPSLAVGSYLLYVVNPDGSSAIVVPGLQVSGLPTWTTSAGLLASPNGGSAFSTTIAATGDAPVIYSIASGTLPTGITLNSSTGVISGTTPTPSSTTTYSFTVRATDAQNQDTDRSFSISVVAATPATLVDYLVVGGGGGGGDTAGGGGGAGGFRTSVGTSGSTDTFNGGGSAAEPKLTVVPGTQYTVTVGAGGTRFNDSTSNSVFSTITSKGGGGGDWDVGGSGGGSSGFGSTTYGSGTRGGGNDKATSGQGCRGGTGFYGSGTTPGGGGGGGGAGQAGANGYYWSAGGGGNGLQNSITGTATWYAGGGGGGASAYGSGGSGGQGGGGAGAVNSPGANGTAGTTNTGGGGGGGHGRDTSFAGAGVGANGGSGIVIIRYPDTYDAAAATTGSPTVTVTGGYRIYKFTSSGTITF